MRNTCKNIPFELGCNTLYINVVVISDLINTDIILRVK